jgi:hypothetical protein
VRKSQQAETGCRSHAHAHGPRDAAASAAVDGQRVVPGPQVGDYVSGAVPGVHVEVDDGDAFEDGVMRERVGGTCRLKRR